MLIFLTLVIPTICYAGAVAYMVYIGNYYDAMMFAGYSFANVGVILRLIQ